MPAFEYPRRRRTSKIGNILLIIYTRSISFSANVQIKVEYMYSKQDKKSKQFTLPFLLSYPPSAFSLFVLSNSLICFSLSPSPLLILPLSFPLFLLLPPSINSTLLYRREQSVSLGPIPSRRNEEELQRNETVVPSC